MQVCFLVSKLPLLAGLILGVIRDITDSRLGHVSGNIMSTTYAVAEKGADLIKEDDGRY